MAFCLFLDDQAGLQDRPDSFPELDRCAQVPRHRRARPAVTCRAGVLFSKPERFNEKWGARPSRSLQSASRRLVFADERGTKRFSRLATECFRPEAENPRQIHEKWEQKWPFDDFIGISTFCFPDFSFSFGPHVLIVNKDVPKCDRPSERKGVKRLKVAWVVRRKVL